MNKIIMQIEVEPKLYSKMILIKKSKGYKTWEDMFEQVFKND